MSAFTHRSSELVPFLFGGVLLIALAGFGMNELSQRSVRTSESGRDQRELEIKVIEREDRIRNYRVDLEREVEKLSELKAGKEVAAMYQKLELALEAEKVVVADLGLVVTEEEAALRELEEKKAAYRAKFRAGHWPKFVNMELTQEHLLGKIPFQDARISEVDAAGLMVRHRSGVARVEVADLEPGFCERLDLSVEEAREVMTEILIRDSRAKRARARRANKTHTPSEEEIEAIIHQRTVKGQARVMKYVRLVRRAERTAKIARHNDRYSSSRSAPGKLETWRERAVRFEKARVRYESLLNEAISQVRRYEPDFRVPTE